MFSYASLPFCGGLSLLFNYSGALESVDDKQHKGNNIGSEEICYNAAVAASGVCDNIHHGKAEGDAGKHQTGPDRSLGCQKIFSAQQAAVENNGLKGISEIHGFSSVKQITLIISSDENKVNL